jgi:hypothetical protein
MVLSYKKLFIGLLSLGSQVLFASSPMTKIPTIGCSASKLSAAIAEGNTAPLTSAGTVVILLEPGCTYVIETPASASEALPVITNNITIIGSKGSVIARSLSAPAVRIFNVNSTGSLTLKNLIVENGDSAGLGGAVLNHGTLATQDVIFSHNRASSGGALAVLAGAEARIFDTEFRFNSAAGVGGGAIINFSNMTIKNSGFLGNTAPINGGAINTQPSSITNISLSKFTHNISGSLGGALSNLGTLNIDLSLISFNKGSSGGGIATGNNNVTLIKTVVVDNCPDNCSPLNTIEGCID